MVEMVNVMPSNVRAETCRYWCISPSSRVIPPEQQAEAQELDAALSELNTVYTQEYQEMVRSDERMFESCFYGIFLGGKNLSRSSMPRMTTSQSGKPSMQRRVRSWYVRLTFDLNLGEMPSESTDMVPLRLR